MGKKFNLMNRLLVHFLGFEVVADHLLRRLVFFFVKNSRRFKLWLLHLSKAYRIPVQFGRNPYLFFKYSTEIKLISIS